MSSLNVRYLHPVDCNPARIVKANQDFAKRLDFKDVKLTVTIRDIHKTEKKKNAIGLAFLVMKTK